MTPDKDAESLRRELSVLTDLYEHHLDLFWKWITLYVTIVSAISVYIFNKDITPSTRRVFPLLIAFASLGVALGCVIMWTWLRELQREVKRISSATNAPRYPSFLGIRMTVTALIISVVFAVFSMLYSAYGPFE